jgi:polar amino acid transport system substrate-binding protein
MSRSRSGIAAVLAAGAIAAAVAGCGSDDDSSSNGSGAASTPAATASGGGAAAANVPAEIKSKGTLTVAADASYPPDEFIDKDGKTVVGMDADLAKALGQQLGLQVNVVNASFDGIIPGLASGKYDLGMSSFTDTKEREQTVDFVTYFSAGTSFYEKASGGPAITDLASLCGHHVAAEKGTTQQADAEAQAKKCPADKKLTVSVFPDQNGANLALSSGRADVGMADSPVAAYQVKQSNGQFKLVGTPYGTAPYGIAIPKGNGLAQPVLDAIKALMADGTYKKTLDQWGLADGAITDPVINGATS